MRLITIKISAVIFCFNLLSPTTASAAVPITQEEIEAILERNQVNAVSSSSLPADLKKRLGQNVASTSDAIRPVITDAVNKAEQAIATATNKISSTSDKIKSNLENYKTQAAADIRESLLGAISSFFSSIWRNISDWLSAIFRGKPSTGSSN